MVFIYILQLEDGKYYVGKIIFNFLSYVLMNLNVNP